MRQKEGTRKSNVNYKKNYYDKDEKKHADKIWDKLKTRT